MTAPCVVFYHTRSLPRGTPEPRGAPGVPRLEYRRPSLYLPAVAPGARAPLSRSTSRSPGKPYVADLGHLRTTRVGSSVAVSGGRRSVCERRASHDPVLFSKRYSHLLKSACLEMSSATKNHHTGAGQEQGRRSGLQRKPAQKRKRCEHTCWLLIATNTWPG